MGALLLGEGARAPGAWAFPCPEDPPGADARVGARAWVEAVEGAELSRVAVVADAAEDAFADVVAAGWALPAEPVPVAVGGVRGAGLTRVAACAEGPVAWISVPVAAADDGGALRDLLRHEAVHVAQHALGPRPSAWWWEAVAVAVEASLAETEGWRGLVDGLLMRPERALGAWSEAPGDVAHAYGAGLWALALDDASPGALHATWVAAGATPGPARAMPLEEVLDAGGTSLDVGHARFLDVLVGGALPGLGGFEPAHAAAGLAAPTGARAAAEGPEGRGVGVLRVDSGLPEGALLHLSLDPRAPWDVVTSDGARELVALGEGSLSLAVGTSGLWLAASPAESSRSREGRAWSWRLELPEAEPEAEDPGCACASGAPRGSWALALVVAVVARRRRCYRAGCDASARVEETT